MKRLFSVLIVIAMLFTAGCQANSIVDIKVEDEAQLIFYMNDGSNINAGAVRGAAGRDGRDGVDGADGIGVAKVSINDSGQLMIRLTDGTLINAGEVKGSDGADGKDGANGRDGADGKDGRDFPLPSGQEEAPDGEAAAAFMMPRPEPFEYSGENRSHFADCGSLGSLWLISEGDNLISFSEDGIFTGCGDINVFYPDSFILNFMYPSQLTADMLGLNGSIAFGTINDQNMPPA